MVWLWHPGHSLLSHTNSTEGLGCPPLNALPSRTSHEASSLCCARPCPALTAQHHHELARCQLHLCLLSSLPVSGPLCTLPPDWGCLRPQLVTSSLPVQAWGCLGTPHTFLHAPLPPMASWLHVGFLLSLCKPGAGRAPAEYPCHCTPALAPPRPQAQWLPLSTCPAQAQPIGAASREAGGGEQGHHTLSLVLA